MIDDGFHSWLVGVAKYESLLEIPSIKPPRRREIPENMIPFSKMKYSAEHKEYVHFYEHDTAFRSFLESPERYVETLYQFPGVITPDCSLYRDMPLVLQMSNTYASRSTGSYLQSQGLNVVPNIRWGDERSYRQHLVGSVPFAFIGVEKNSIVSISTYGCIRGNENRRHFRDGLCAMMEYLAPRMVLVHGAMPDEVFCDVVDLADFHQFDNWIAQKRKKVG